LLRSSSLSHSLRFLSFSFFFLFNHPPTSVLYTLSLHDALPICTCTLFTILKIFCPYPHPLVCWDTDYFHCFIYNVTYYVLNILSFFIIFIYNLTMYFFFEFNQYMGFTCCHWF